MWSIHSLRRSPVNPQLLPARTTGDGSTWDQALYAFLVEKGSRSGSTRTVESYARMLWPFFAERTPDQVRSADVLAYAHGIGQSGRTPSSATVGARIACVSSFYRFGIRMGILTANPCDALERPRTVPSAARGYSADEFRGLLPVVPDTVRGRRDRAILLVLVLTGRRRAEVMSLRAGDLSLEGETAFYASRGKGGKRGRGGRSRGPESASPGSRAAPSAPASGAISRWPVWRQLASTSCATPRRSCGATAGSRSRR